MTARTILGITLLATLQVQVFAQWNPNQDVSDRVREYRDFHEEWNVAAEKYAVKNELDYFAGPIDTEFELPSNYVGAVRHIMNEVRVFDDYQTLSDSEMNDLFTGAFLYAHTNSMCFWPCCPDLTLMPPQQP